jgi:hypothetical protein
MAKRGRPRVPRWVVDLEAILFARAIESELKRGVILERAMDAVRRRDPRRWRSRRTRFRLWDRYHRYRDRAAQEASLERIAHYEMVERMIDNDPARAEQSDDPYIWERARERRLAEERIERALAQMQKLQQTPTLETIKKLLK